MFSATKMMMATGTPAPAVPPAFDSKGTTGISAALGFNPSINGSYTHTLTAAGAVVVVAFNQHTGQTLAAQTTKTCTIGGVAASLLGSVQWDSDKSVMAFGLTGVTSSAKTVAVTVGSGSNTGRGLCVQSYAYTGVSSFGTFYSNTGNSTTGSVNVAASAANEIVLAAFLALVGGVPTWSALTPASARDNLTNGASGLTGVIGDSVGTGSAMTETATRPGGSGQWGGIALRIIGT